MIGRERRNADGWYPRVLRTMRNHELQRKETEKLGPVIKEDWIRWHTKKRVASRVFWAAVSIIGIVSVVMSAWLYRDWTYIAFGVPCCAITLDRAVRDKP